MASSPNAGMIPVDLEPDSSDEEQPESVDKFLLDLRKCERAFGGCEGMSYLRKTGCLNVHCKILNVTHTHDF
jgi:hypothetical protein